MNTRGRLFLTALRTARFMPVSGLLIGASAGLVYWVAAQIWPTSVAVVVSMLATTALRARANAVGFGPLAAVFAILIRYNTLMALSAASLPFALPPNVALGVIMIAGHAASRALVVSVMALPQRPATKLVSNGDLALALAIGFAPAAAIGIPGLIGLVAAIIGRIAYTALIGRSHGAPGHDSLDVVQQLTEVCFYLGALASRAYI